MNILERSRDLVCQMNLFEANRLSLRTLPMTGWPNWAQRDFRLACAALVEVRKQALEERTAGRRPLTTEEI